MTRALVALTCVACALALAACGGGSGGSSEERLSKEEYQQRVTELGDKLEAEFNDISQADKDDLAELPPLMDRLGEALDATADGFDALTPPEEIDEEHRRFVAAARATADDAREIGDRLASEPVTELSAADIADLDISRSENFLELQQAMKDITAKGYEFGDNFGG